MKQTTTHLCLELEVPTDTAERCVLAAMAPMTALSVGRRSILLTSRQMSAAALFSALEEACGSCDSLCEESAYPDENAEAILQAIPAELLQKLRERGLCMRQLARHLKKGDAVYGR